MNDINLIESPIKYKKTNEEVTVSKDILDLITSSMYVNPLDVYREYIQNSADAIDVAKEKKLDFRDESPNVKISFDHATRSVKIIDNGVSISQKHFLKRILSIGGSEKRGSKLRGFRGVGRLAGLGYCQSLIFRGRASKNEKVTELVWDGRLLKKLYRDKNYNSSLGKLIGEITEYRVFDDEKYPDRFFEVELVKLARLKSDVLLNESAIAKFLGQVAPVDFDDNFKFKTKINDYLKKYEIKDPIRISIEGYGEVLKPYKNEFAFSDFISDSFKEVCFKEFYDSDNNLLAICWYLDHDYLGFIPKVMVLPVLDSEMEIFKLVTKL